jgi:hypothetical protein
MLSCSSLIVRSKLTRVRRLVLRTFFRHLCTEKLDEAVLTGLAKVVDASSLLPEDRPASMQVRLAGLASRTRPPMPSGGVDSPASVSLAQFTPKDFPVSSSASAGVIAGRGVFSPPVPQPLARGALNKFTSAAMDGAATPVVSVRDGMVTPQARAPMRWPSAVSAVSIAPAAAQLNRSESMRSVILPSDQPTQLLVATPLATPAPTAASVAPIVVFADPTETDPTQVLSDPMDVDDAPGPTAASSDAGSRSSDKENHVNRSGPAEHSRKKQKLSRTTSKSSGSDGDSERGLRKSSRAANTTTSNERPLRNKTNATKRR